MSSPAILHETSRRLRVGLARDEDFESLRDDLARLPGVASVRYSAAMLCVVVQHDGGAETRVAVLSRLRSGTASKPQRRRTAVPTLPARPSAWAPALMAAAVPVLTKGWRRSAALALIATRVLSQPARLRSDAPAVLLDAASLAALAINGQPLVVSTSVLLRLLSEGLSARLVRQADSLLSHLLPTEATRYTARLASGKGATWAWHPLRALRAGDRVRLVAGDVVPVDGCVVDGTATLMPAAQHGEPRPVKAGEHVASGERLHDGTLELHAECDPASSRLAHLRKQVQHAVDSQDPPGRLAPDLERLLSLPLTAATLVFGLTGDSARAAAMLQADPRQGLDLAFPLRREAALYALARHGLLTAGVEAIERLATARTLVLQDTGVLATGRWSVEAVHTEPGGDDEPVRGWLAALAGTPMEIFESASFPDALVRQWVRHGAVLRVGAHELHLASPLRLQQIWALPTKPFVESASPTGTRWRLRREFAVVADGRVVAWVVLVSAMRPAVADQLRKLAALGFERMAVFGEGTGGEPGRSATGPWSHLPQLEPVADDFDEHSDWISAALQDGKPMVLVHSVLRDLVPPGSLSLCPMDSDGGSHGVLLGDPLQSLVAARQIAQQVHRRLRLQQGTAVAANAALMTAAALQWLPPIAIALLHHTHALLLLLDSLRIESLDASPEPLKQAPRRNGQSPHPAKVAKTKINRSKTA